MKIKNSNKVVLIATLILGFLIVVNLDDSPSTIGFQGLSATEYQKAIEEKNKLMNEINSLSDTNTDLEEKINKYNRSHNSEEVVNDMKEQLSDYGMISGLNEVKGPGVSVQINDGKYNSSNDIDYQLLKILHDKDVENVINQLKVAGAEAIALNDHRIISTTGVKCKWAFIVFDDGDEEYPVFNFYAIGDPDLMETELLREGGYLNKLVLRGLDVSIEKKEEIVLKAGNIPVLNYVKERIDKN